MRKLIALCLLLASCQTVTIRPEGGIRNESEPDWESTQHFFLWGLAPDARFVNVDDVCKKSKVEQMQAQDTFLDGFLGIITLGIYSPRTAKIWCDDSQRDRRDIEEASR